MSDNDHQTEQGTSMAGKFHMGITYFSVAYWVYIVKLAIFSPAVKDFDVLLNIPLVMNASFVVITSLYALYNGRVGLFLILYVGFLSTGVVL